MTNEFEYDTIKSLLDKTQCPYRLYPARIKALDIISNQNFEFEIQRYITSGIADHISDMGWVQQFLSDLDTFGLYEAILYFHTYPFPKEAKIFLHKACEIYNAIASQYLIHHRSIIDSDDPRIIDQIRIIQFMGEEYRHVSRLRMPPLTRPEKIVSPAKPPSEPNYQRVLEMSDELKQVYEWSGQVSTKGPGNLADELLETLQAKFMFEGFPGIQTVFFDTTDLLWKHEVDPFGSTGQYILETIIGNINQEMFGDFMRWVKCIICDQEFMPEISLQSANENLINGGWICLQCQSSSQN